jgi:hypothetical protein
MNITLNDKVAIITGINLNKLNLFILNAVFLLKIKVPLQESVQK